MSDATNSYKSATLPGLARAFRRWAATLDELTPVAVPGASLDERHRLAALGGIAAAIAGDAVHNWDEPIRSWAVSGPAPPGRIVEATRLALGRDHDPLAALYNASISAANRRRLGTVFTPSALVRHALTLAENELGCPPAAVVDPGAGVGAFTIAVAQAWPSARIVAVDINPVTLGLLGARLAFEADIDPERAPAYRRVELKLDNYLDHLVCLFGEGQPGPVLVLGNPPYTRVQELPKADREKAASLAGDAIDSGHANLAMLFQAATLQRMRPTDVSCMVLPGSFSYTRASRALRGALWASTRAVTVHRTPATVKAFTGRSVQAAVLLVGKERQRRNPLRLARVQLGDAGVDVIEMWTLPRTGDQPDNWFWSDTDRRPERGDSLLLGDVAVVRRGTATGANEMFFLTDAGKAALPAEVVVTAIPSLREFNGDELTVAAHTGYGDDSTRRWLLAIPPDRVLDGALGEYVERYRADVSERHLAAQRSPWYSIAELPRPQIVLSPLSRTDFKVVLNTAQAVPSNNLFGITLENGHAPEPLIDWLRSPAGQNELRRLSRRYPGGSHKLEPGRLRAVRLPVSVIDPRT